MSHELWLLKGSTMTNITPLVGSISWKSNLDELGDELSFTVAFNDGRFFPKNPCDIGNVVVLKNNNVEITRTVIVDESKNGRSPISYTTFDYAFYLNKSTAIYQFNKMNAIQAIKKILSDFNVPIGNMVSVPTVITKIYNNKKVSEIISDIIDIVRQSTGQKLMMEMRQGKLYIVKQGYEKIKGIFKLVDNFGANDVTSAIINPSRKRSISEMINTIQVVSDDKLVLQKADTTMVNKYGRLQKVIELNSESNLTAIQLAQNELENLSKVAEETSVELLGDDRFRAGKLFDITESVTGINGTYLITNVEHSLQNGVHMMKLGLEVS